MFGLVSGVVTLVGSNLAPSIGTCLLSGFFVKNATKKVVSNLVVAEYGPGGEILSMTTDGVKDGKWISIIRDAAGDIVDISTTGF